ncbi:unnamed protein product [Nippostrongylus brasiliensis]|uniref:Legumain (inferred by orthology to a human protein) n=1 Tax=Nippostrongylus brasiliensis TaxID=27835 RepID=A0A0N4XD18_NIPBR|nr:unnamed protein product [Nippostrongylus brasiliensis]
MGKFRCNIFREFRGPPRSIYALLVAGSNGFSNYRHQADVAHAYHVLLQHGVPAENIVTMMYDDVAYDPRTTSVNKLVFQAVLLGDAGMVKLYEGSGRVLGRLRGVRPAEEAKRLAIAGIDPTMGSLETASRPFSPLALRTRQVNGLTASNATEDSYACNCAGSICYADQFSYQWMTNSEQQNIMELSVSQQYTDVKRNVRSSTVQMFGSSAVTSVPVGYFQGMSAATLSQPRRVEPRILSDLPLGVINIRDVPLVSLSMSASLADGTPEGTEIRRQLQLMLRKRERFDEIFRDLLTLLRRTITNTDSAVGLELQDKCYEDIVRKFDLHCFPLSQNPYAFGSLKRFRQLCEHADVLSVTGVTEVLQKFCSSNPEVQQAQGVE